ncbi:hypothetical protein [Rubrivirga marina]|uniref:Sulfotransferase domain-containing protein n=1 Tax=Rubrivirga marina TaxID=1196024 RepID=A0A271IXN3_9BACT|nr:hypothetical protein [Rubrivirga marina]PAP75962.1 hypothetical protein BSZ37_05665 [Rubrivirga marina]
MTATAPLLHIGYMKTGSTWLQRHVASDAATGLGLIAEREDLTELLVRPTVLGYDAGVIRALVAGPLRECERRGLVPFISHERLSGNPISGGFDSTIVADRLADLFPEARVAIVIREQRSFLASFYNEYVCGGGACSLRAFLHPPPGAKLPLFTAGFLEYDRLIGYYQERFGRDRVLVLPYESLRRDPLAFCNRLITFGGGRPLAAVPTEATRRSRSWAVLGLQRGLNFALFRDSSNPAAPVRIPNINRVADVASRATPASVDRWAKRRAAALIADFVGTRYAESNRRTQASVEASLGELGYDLAPEQTVPLAPVRDAGAEVLVP